MRSAAVMLVLVVVSAPLAESAAVGTLQEPFVFIDDIELIEGMPFGSEGDSSSLLHLLSQSDPPTSLRLRTRSIGSRGARHRICTTTVTAGGVLDLRECGYQTESRYAKLAASAIFHTSLGRRRARLDAYVVDLLEPSAGSRSVSIRQFAGGRFATTRDWCEGADDCVRRLNLRKEEYEMSLPAGVARDIKWGDHGWFVSTTPVVLHSGGQRDDRLHLQVGRIDVSSSSTIELSKLAAVLCGPGLSQRPSATRSGLLQRDIAIHGVSRTRARVVFQLGILDELTIDDGLAVMDVCGDPVDGTLRRCDGPRNTAIAPGCPELGGGPFATLQVPVWPAASGRTVNAPVKPAAPRPAEADDGRRKACERSASESAVILSETGGWEGAPAFSPDGRWLAYLRTSGPPQGIPEDDESRPLDLWVVRNSADLGSFCNPGTMVNLTADFEPSVTAHAWSCHGRCVLLQANKAGRLAIYQVDLERRSGNIDRWLDLHAWRRLSDADAPVFNPVLVPSPELDVWQAEQHVKRFVPSGSGRTLFLVLNSMDHPRERLYRCTRPSASGDVPFKFESRHCTLLSVPTPKGELAGIGIRRLGDAADHGLRIRRCLRPASGGGAREGPGMSDCTTPTVDALRYIPGYVFLPPGFLDLAPDRSGTCSGKDKFPVLIYIHGGPHSVSTAGLSVLQYRLLRPQFRPAAGRMSEARPFVVIAPNIIGSAGFGEDYRQAVQGEWGGQALWDIASVVSYARSLGCGDAGRNELAGRIDPESVFLLGESYGGYLVSLIAAGGGDLPGDASRGVAPSFGAGRRVEGRTLAGSLDGLAGGVSVFGVFDLRQFPCRTDQKWFAARQFGYKHGDGGRQPLHPGKDCEQQHEYKPAFDPAHVLRSDPHSVRRFPVLAVHGTHDLRVEVQHGKALARALFAHRVHVDARHRGVQVCEVPGGLHGFARDKVQLVARAVTEWREKCLHEPRCDLTLHTVPEAQPVTDVDCSPKARCSWIAEGAKWPVEPGAAARRPLSAELGIQCEL